MYSLKTTVEWKIHKHPNIWLAYQNCAPRQQDKVEHALNL